MFLTEEAFWFAVRNGAFIATLLVCAALLFWRPLRDRTNPMAWLVWATLGAGALWYGQYPVTAAQTAWFKSHNPGYAAQARPFAGRSVHIPDVEALQLAAYGCYDIYSSSLCTFPLSELIKSGRLDFVEIGTDPVMRYAATYMDPACLEWDAPPRDPVYDPRGALLNGGMISPAMGACILPRVVQSAGAEHVITVQERITAPPLRGTYLNAQLHDRATGTMIDQFDGWYDAMPYLAFEMPREPRRAAGPLGTLVARPVSQTRYDPTTDDALIAAHGIDEALVLRALEAPLQSVRANTVFLACRDTVAAALSAQARAAVSEAAAGLFDDSPDWRYPRDCMPHLR